MIILIYNRRIQKYIFFVLIFKKYIDVSKLIKAEADMNRSSSDSTHVPFGLTQWTQITTLDPLGHATIVKRMIAFAPNNFLFCFSICRDRKICIQYIQYYNRVMNTYLHNRHVYYRFDILGMSLEYQREEKKVNIERKREENK